ncbi:MAG: CHAT domain-containing protein [Candidatus Acidiferrum sp.]
MADVDVARRRYGSRSVEWDWRFLILKARILVSRSQCDETVSLLKPEVPPELVMTDVPEQRELYLGIAHRCMHDLKAAEKDFAQAENLLASLPPTYVAQFLLARGGLRVNEGELSKAEEDYRIALSLARRNSLRDVEANALADTARFATIKKHFDEALDLNHAALDLSEALQMRGNTATILGNLGWGYGELGDFEASLDFYKQAAEASARNGMAGYSDYWFSGVATAYMFLRDYSAGEKLALTTLQQAKERKDAQTSLACLHALAEIMLRNNRLSDAQQYIQEAIALETNINDQGGAYDDTLTLAGEIAVAQSRFSNAESLFQQVLSDPNAGPKLRWEAEAGLARIRDGQSQFAEVERHYLSAIDTIERARKSIDHDELRLSFLSSGIAVYDQYIEFLIRRGRFADALMQAELSRARTLAEGLGTMEKAPRVSAKNLQPQQLARKLNATLLFYWMGEKHSYLWVITPAKTACLPIPAASEIDPAVKSYREGVAASRDVAKTDQAAGEKLYALLVAPTQRLIPQNSRVILLPDGSLYSLNFETLIVPSPQPHFWIEDVSLTTAGSLSLLASGASRPLPKQKNLLLVGDALQAAKDFEKLPQAEDEMQSVERYFADSNRTVLKGEQATPSAYLGSNPERYAYLHFVTHGTASRTRPLESAVILSKDPASDSYKLYARDIVTRHLNAELVTISACNGSGNRAYSGEGLVGLSWAFLRAGAHHVIGALWEVSNAPSTSQLMDAFYRGLSQGQDPASALRDAKLSLLRSGGVFKKPYYWGPFQLYAGS